MQANHRPARPRRWELVARYTPPLILIVVALVQISLAGFEGSLLTAGKGGGFGLFSAVDNMGNRQLRLYVIDAADRERPRSSRELRRHPRRIVTRATAFPTQAHLRAVAERAAERIEPEAGEKLRLEVWKRRFDAEIREVRRLEVARYLLDPHAVSD